MMSETKNEAIICPKCGKAMQTAFEPTVNVRRNPKVRDLIMSDEFFNCKCKHCGYKGSVLARCLYHDELRGFMVYLMPDFSEPCLFDEQIERAYPEMANVPRRVVSNINRMKEKILLFESRIDDRAVELSKLAIAGMISRKASRKLQEAYFNELDEKQNLIGFTFFAEGEPEPVEYRTRAEIYHVSREIAQKYLDNHPEQGFSNIDLRWAAKALAEHRRAGDRFEDQKGE